ncbi:MAG: alpha/beta hydrolase [Acidimicrobiales bacterium]
MTVDPQTRALIDLMASFGLPRPETMKAPDVREMFAAGRDTRPAGPKLARVEDVTVGGATGELAARIYAKSAKAPLPAIIYFHGGGWVLGDVDGDDPACRQLAASSGAMVISVDYRHAPEHRFPAATDDCYAATVWLGEHAARFGADPARLMVAGWSAGGNLAAVTAQRVRDDGGPALRGQALVTPVTDYDPQRPSWQDNAEGYVLTAPFMEWFWKQYQPHARRRTNPLASPLRAKDLRNLPPALVLTAEYDPLRDEGEAYAAALVAAGNEVVARRWLGQAHIVWGQWGVLDASKASQDWVAAFCKRVLS